MKTKTDKPRPKADPRLAIRLIRYVADGEGMTQEAVLWSIVRPTRRKA
jgi:hypothetical protein